MGKHMYIQSGHWCISHQRERGRDLANWYLLLVLACVFCALGITA